MIRQIKTIAELSQWICDAGIEHVKIEAVGSMYDVTARKKGTLYSDRAYSISEALEKTALGVAQDEDNLAHARKTT